MLNPQKAKTIRSRQVIVLALLTLFLSGCVTLNDPETSQEYNSQVVAILRPGETAGQTFIARRPGLSSLTIWLTQPPEDASLTFSLFHHPQDEQPLQRATIPAADGALTIKFTPRPDPAAQAYYVEISTSAGEVSLMGRLEEAYPLGRAFLDGNPLEADLAFRTGYQYNWSAISTDLSGLAGQSWQVLAFGIFLLPGWLLVECTALKSKLDLGDRLSLSLGLSLAVYPLGMVWTSYFGLQWNQTSVKLGSALLLILFLVGVGWQRKKQHRPRSTATDLLLVSIFLFSFFLRYTMIRDLATPAWVDSIHHSLITRGILNNGGLPVNNLPYIPVEAHQYHPGYHILLAIYLWLTGLSLPAGMLLFGQILNAMMVFGAYSFTRTFTKSQVAGLAAGLIVGVFSPMPAYYTTWGRYTQLVGLFGLPAVNLLIQTPFRQKFTLPKIQLIGFIGLLLAGIFIIHYRVLIFLILLIAAIWLSRVYRPNNSTRPEIWESLQTIFWAGWLSLLLSLPWLLPTITQFVLPRTVNRSGSGAAFAGINWRYFTAASGIPILILAALGLVWGLYRRRRFAIAVFVWGILLFAVAKPNPFGINFLPPFVNQTAVEIMLFMPISVLGGYFVSEVILWPQKWLPSKQKNTWKVGGGILIIGLTLSGAQRLLPIFNPITIQSRQNDLAAIEWIHKNIPPDEIIVINPAGWGYGLYMGNDGGYWISALANQQTIPPNALYGMNRAGRVAINQFVEDLLNIGSDADQIWELMQAHELRYVYIGVRGGVLSPRALAASNLFEVRYQGDGTWLFERVLIRP